MNDNDWVFHVYDVYMFNLNAFFTISDRVNIATTYTFHMDVLASYLKTDMSVWSATLPMLARIWKENNQTTVLS